MRPAGASVIGRITDHDLRRKSGRVPCRREDSCQSLKTLAAYTQWMGKPFAKGWLASSVWFSLDPEWPSPDGRCLMSYADDWTMNGTYA